MSKCTICSPDNPEEDCLSYSELIIIAKAYNENIKSNPISIPDYESYESNTKLKTKLIEEIDQKMRHLCPIKKDMRCWIDKLKLSNVINTKLKFKPIPPESQFKWLDTNNIRQVLTQHVNKFNKKDPKTILFFGAIPSDAYKHINKYEDFKDLLNTKKILEYQNAAMIFNFDVLGGKGSHWVATFIDNPHQTIYYYDSYGENPIKNIYNYLYMLKNKFKDHYTNYKIIENEHRAQYGDSECGVYSIDFIVRMLQGESFNKITSERLSDQVINNKRNYYFYNPKILEKCKI